MSFFVEQPLGGPRVVKGEPLTPQAIGSARVVMKARPDDPKLLIYCGRLQANVHRAHALEEVLDSDVKNADGICGACRNQCFN